MKFDAAAVTRGAFWSTLGAGLSTVIKFVSIPVLARLLSPEEFGVAALVMAIASMALMLGGRSGFGAALVYFHSRCEDYIYTAFWASLISGVCLGALTYFSAEMIAQFFSVPSAKPYLQAVSFCFPIMMLASVGRSQLTATMQFRKIATVLTVSSFLSTVAALVAAVFGLGAWSLVLQFVFFSLLNTAGFIWQSSFRPAWVFDVHALRAMAPFAARVTLADTFTWIGQEGPVLILSRLAGAAGTGFYRVAQRVASMPREILVEGMSNALFAQVAGGKNLPEEISRGVLWSLKVNIYTLTAIYLALAALAPAIVKVLLGQSYMEAWPLFCCLCLGMALSGPFSGLVASLKGIGKTSCVLWLSGFRSLFVVIGVAGGWLINESLLAVGIGFIAAQVAILILNLAVTSRQFRITFTALAVCLSRPACVAFIVGILLYLNQWQLHLLLQPLSLLVFSGIVFLAAYCLLMWLLAREDFIGVREGMLGLCGRR